MERISTKILSFNCEGASRNRDCIKYIIKAIYPDIICLQETWLLDNKIHVIENLVKSYITKGKAGINIKNEILVGRPSGRTIIMYKASLDKYVSIIPCKSKRIYAVKLNHSCDNTLLINVYMPCDNRCVNHVNSDFTDTIDEIECLMNVSETRVILCGDWNCDFSRNTAQVKYLLDFIEIQKLHIAWSNINDVPDFTYINDSIDHRSYIDHCIVSENVYNTIDKMYVSPNGINLSKHALIVMT